MHILNRDTTNQPAAEAAINLAVIYEDGSTREWARAACKLVNELAGVDCMRSRAWSVTQLNDPAVFPKAARTAALADVIILALHAAAELPALLCAWFEVWLPLRDRPVGALVSLMDVNGKSKIVPFDVRNYLGAVAQRGRLDLLIEEQKLPAPPTKTVLSEKNPESLGARFDSADQESNPYERWNHWGIND